MLPPTRLLSNPPRVVWTNGLYCYEGEEVAGPEDTSVGRDGVRIELRLNITIQYLIDLLETRVHVELLAGFYYACLSPRSPRSDPLAQGL